MSLRASNSNKIETEKGTEKGRISMAEQIKVHLTHGNYFTRKDHQYIAAGREGNECGARCPRHPYYRCTRDKGHELNGGRNEADRDHAAHGWAHGLARRLIVMYARWSQ